MTKRSAPLSLEIKVVYGNAFIEWHGEYCKQYVAAQMIVDVVCVYRLFYLGITINLTGTIRFGKKIGLGLGYTLA